MILVNFERKRPAGDVYRGRLRTGSTKAVVTVNGKRLELDLEEFSPTGFSWGYRGTGPAQLAPAVLARAGGDETARAEWERFREAFIGELDIRQPFKFTAQDIAAFLNGLPVDAREFIKPVRKQWLVAVWKRRRRTAGGKR